MSSEDGFAFLIWGVWHGLRSKAEHWSPLPKACVGLMVLLGGLGKVGVRPWGTGKCPCLGVCHPKWDIWNGFWAGWGNPVGLSGLMQPWGCPWGPCLHSVNTSKWAKSCILQGPLARHHNHRSASVPEQWVRAGYYTISKTCYSAKHTRNNSLSYFYAGKPKGSWSKAPVRPVLDLTNIYAVVWHTVSVPATMLLKQLKFYSNLKLNIVNLNILYLSAKYGRTKAAVIRNW